MSPFPNVRPAARALAVLGGCLLSAAPAAAGDTDAGPSSAMAVAERLVEAYNRHEADAMAALVTDDFELYYGRLLARRLRGA